MPASRNICAKRSVASVTETPASVRERRSRRAFGRQQFGLMFGHQCVDHIGERLAFHHLRQFVERQVDAVIGDATLREIIGADAFGAVAGADLAAPLGRALGVELAALLVVELGAQVGHRLGLVLVLRALFLHEDDDSARQYG